MVNAHITHIRIAEAVVHGGLFQICDLFYLFGFLLEKIKKKKNINAKSLFFK